MKAMKTHILNKIERLRQETPLPESNNTLEFEDDYNLVEKASINRVVRTKHGDYEKAWASFGFMYDKGPPIRLYKNPLFCEHATSDSESLDSCDSWSTSDDESTISNLIDDETKPSDYIDNESHSNSPR